MTEAIAHELAAAVATDLLQEDIRCRVLRILGYSRTVNRYAGAAYGERRNLSMLCAEEIDRLVEIRLSTRPKFSTGLSIIFKYLGISKDRTIRIIGRSVPTGIRLHISPALKRQELEGPESSGREDTIIPRQIDDREDFFINGSVQTLVPVLEDAVHRLVVIFEHMNGDALIVGVVLHGALRQTPGRSGGVYPSILGMGLSDLSTIDIGQAVNLIHENFLAACEGKGCIHALIVVRNFIQTAADDLVSGIFSLRIESIGVTSGSIVVLLPSSFIQSYAGKQSCCYHGVDCIDFGFAGSVAVVHGELEISNHVVHNLNAGIAGTGDIFFFGEVNLFFNPYYISVGADEIIIIQGPKETCNAPPMICGCIRKTGNLINSVQKDIGFADSVVVGVPCTG